MANKTRAFVMLTLGIAGFGLALWLALTSTPPSQRTLYTVVVIILAGAGVALAFAIKKRR